MLDRIAFAISFIFSPFLVQIAASLVVVPSIRAVTSGQALLWTLIIILFFSVLPSLFILILARSGHLSDLHLSVQEQRLVPLCFAVISGLVGTGILYRINAPRKLVWVGIVYAVNGTIFTAITPLWKISFHSGVTAACITTLTLLVNVQFAWLFLLLPPVAWSRVHRKRHTIPQTVVAALVSIVCTAAALQFSL